MFLTGKSLELLQIFLASFAARRASLPFFATKHARTKTSKAIASQAKLRDAMQGKHQTGRNGLATFLSTLSEQSRSLPCNLQTLRVNSAHGQIFTLLRCRSA